MTPIEKVTPALPGNWTRRPEAKIRRGGEQGQSKDQGKDHKPAGQKRSGPGTDHNRDQDPGERTHIVDELA